METNARPTSESDLPTGLYSEEEKAQILAQIEQAAGANRLDVDADVFRPRKKGILFPVLVNVAAVVLIVVAWFAADSYFQTRQKTLSLKSDQLFSAESKLLAKVLEDAKAQMDAAKAEIDKIQSDLQRAANDKANLQKSFEDRVAEQDRALRQELSNTLAAERSRLQASGLNADEVARRLKEFESQKNDEFSARLEGYRKQAQAEIEQQTKALDALQTRLQTTVAEQERLRSELEKRTREREGALQSQLSTQAADLEALRQERDAMDLFLRQTDAAIASVHTAFEARDWAKARASVTSLRQVLSRASESASEAVRNRVASQTGLADALGFAATTLDQSLSTAEHQSQLEAARNQGRQETAALKAQLEAGQAALVNAQTRWREAEATAETLRQEIDALVARLDQATNETFEARIDAQYLDSRVGELERSLTELTQQVAAARDAQGARLKALADVRAFTVYLRGQSATPNESKASIEQLAKSDAAYKQVIEDIQALAEAGSGESAVNTAQVALYGTVAAVSKNKVVLEPLTKVKPEVGQMIEIRRTKGKKETTIGQGAVLTSTKQRVEIDWTGQPGTPLSGDAAYLVLP